MGQVQGRHTDAQQLLAPADSKQAVQLLLKRTPERPPERRTPSGINGTGDRRQNQGERSPDRQQTEAQWRVFKMDHEEDENSRQYGVD